jgi:hypothetical protein
MNTAMRRFWVICIGAWEALFGIKTTASKLPVVKFAQAGRKNVNMSL